MDWITSAVAIGDCTEPRPYGAVVLDLRGIPDHCRIHMAALDQSVDCINQNVLAGWRVFVHCIGGISRSPSIVAAYLSLHHRMTVDAAFDLIRSKRPSIQPHADQIASVKEWRARHA